MIKISDLIAEFLAVQGIKHVFAITGGASIHMIHSIAEHKDIKYICPHHEQAGAMAADAYSRINGNIGCAIATSGPGATNLLTGIAGAWFDSIPVLYLTGQVARFRFKGKTGIRQMGFQETDIISMAKSITKYAVLITKAEDLIPELEKAIKIAKSGRPGPVLVDIPDDLQREMVSQDLINYNKPIFIKKSDGKKPYQKDIDNCLLMIKKAKRPVIVIGSGVRLANAIDEVVDLIDYLKIPVCPSWAAADIIPADSPYFGGTFGTHGTRAGNFVIQNADLILAIGARLSTHETGSPMKSWAREAKTIIVDIDPSELRKFPAFEKPIDLSIECDAGAFVNMLLETLKKNKISNFKKWVNQVYEWHQKYPICSPKYHLEKFINPYVFIHTLSEHLEKDDVIIVDTGCAVAWTLQGFRFKKGQRILHAFNNTPMGYALPAAIGASFALGKDRRVICIAGDGSLMMNLQELSTVQHEKLNIKLFLINNDGYAMVQQTQEQWLGANYYATSHEGGLSFPDFQLLAKSFEFNCTEILENKHVNERILETLRISGPVLCDVRISKHHRVVPQSKFGRPIEDSDPMLPRNEFLENMIIKPMDVSLND